MFLAILVLSSLCVAAPQAHERPSIHEILDAIRTIETGGERKGGQDMIGDNGRSIGPYQIQRDYWIDAGLPGRYEDCHDPDYARRVVLAYWRRYCPDALERCDAEILARTHNGGPRGPRKECTLRHWRRIERELQGRRMPASSAG